MPQADKVTKVAKRVSADEARRLAREMEGAARVEATRPK